MKQLSNQQVINFLNALILKIDSQDKILTENASEKDKKQIESETNEAISAITKTSMLISIYN